MNLNKENLRHIRWLILFTVILFLGIQRFDVIIMIMTYIWDLLFPFVLGLCIAYLVSVPMRFIERVLFTPKKKPLGKFWVKTKRSISLFITFILVMGIIAVVMFVVVPELITTGESLYKSIPGFMRDVQRTFDELMLKYPFVAEHLNEFEFDWSSVTNALVNFVKNDLLTTLNSTVQIAKNIMGTMLDVLIAVFFSIYVLMQKEKLARQSKAVLSAFFKPSTTRTVVRITRLADATFSSFFSGQCIEAVIMGTLFVIAMTIFGFPYAVMVGVLIAFTALIPVFGPLIGCVISALLILISSPVQAFWFVVMFFVLQLIEENLIYPHVVGNAVGLPPMWVLAAVSLGGSLFGIVGMLFFIPLVSVLYALFREVVYKKIKKKREKGELAPGNPQEPLLEKDKETMPTEGDQTEEGVSRKKQASEARIAKRRGRDLARSPQNDSQNDEEISQ